MLNYQRVILNVEHVACCRCVSTCPAVCWCWDRVLSLGLHLCDTCCTLGAAHPAMFCWRWPYEGPVWRKEFGAPFNLVEETRHSYIRWILRGSWAKQPQKQTVHCLGNPWWSIHTSLLPLACLCVFPCSRDTTQIIASSFPGSQSHRVLIYVDFAHQRKHHQTPGLRMHHLYSKYYDIY